MRFTLQLGCHGVASILTIAGVSMSASMPWCEFLKRNLSRALPLLAAAVALLLVGLPLFSQTSQGTIQGSVFDQSGGAIAGAPVAVYAVAPGLVRTISAGSAGEDGAPR